METQSIIENKRKQHRRSEIGVTKGGIRPSGGNAGVFEQNLPKLHQSAFN